jgi:hypothetical protein
MNRGGQADRTNSLRRTPVTIWFFGTYSQLDTFQQ